VPPLKGKKLAKAKQLLSKSSCATGKITRKKANKAKRGKVLSPGLGKENSTDGWSFPPPHPQALTIASVRAADDADL
jgi:hypothetical protein